MTTRATAPFFRTGQLGSNSSNGRNSTYQRQNQAPFPPRNNRPQSRNADRTTPQSLEGEQSTLGACMMDKAAIEKARAILTADDFYRELHKKIWHVLLALYDAGQPIDLVTVIEELRNRGEMEEIGGAAYLTALIEACPSAANIESYAEKVLEKSLARQALREIEILSSCLTVAPQLDDYGKELERLDFLKPLAHAQDRLKEIQERRFARHSSQEYSFDSVLDNILDDVSWLWPGWIPRGSLTLLAGKPGAGKSTVAMDICKRIITHTPWPDGSPMQYADPFQDHDEEETPTRLLWIDTESALGIFRQRLHEWGFPRDHFVFAKGNELEPVRVDDDRSWAWVEKAVQDHRPPLVVLDSLSYAHGGEENSNDWMKFVMRRMADLAGEYNVAFIVIHHLSKLPPGSTDWPPTLDMIRGASAITQYSRSVISVGTPDKSTPLAHGMANIKINHGFPPEPLGYETTNVGPAWGEVPQSGGDKPIDKAKLWLKMQLEDGPKLAEDLKTMIVELGICSVRTLEAAKSELKVVVKKETGGNGRWFWMLP